MAKAMRVALFGLYFGFSGVAYAEQLSCKQGYDKTKMECSVVADQVSVIGYQINRGRCSGAQFDFPIIVKDPGIIGLMSFDLRADIQFRIAQINHIIEGKAERYKGFEPSARIQEMDDSEISLLFGELMDVKIDGSGMPLSGELIVSPSDITSELLSSLWLNFNLPVIGTYHFGDQFSVNADCEILEVQFETQSGPVVVRTY